LISEGSSKLASVPSGGSGGGAAASSGGAAAGGAAAAEEKAEEKKEEGMFCIHWRHQPGRRTVTNSVCREGRVRRGHGLWSFRLSVCCIECSPVTSNIWPILLDDFWKELCELSCLLRVENLIGRGNLYRSSANVFDTLLVRYAMRRTSSNTVATRRDFTSPFSQTVVCTPAMGYLKISIELY
jgi:hypothetical protein